MYYLDESAIIIAVLEFLGAMICCIALMAQVLNRIKGKRGSRTLNGIIISLLITLLSDGVCYLIDGNPLGGYRMVNQILIFIDYISILISLMLTVRFVALHMPWELTKTQKRVIAFIYGLLGADFVLVLVNLFTSFIYGIDDSNVYYLNDGFYVYNGVLLLVSIIIIVGLFVNRRKLKNYGYLTMEASIFALTIGILCEIFMDDVPGTNIGMCVGLLFLFWVYISDKRNHRSENIRQMLIIMYLFMSMTICIFISYIVNMVNTMKQTRMETESNSRIMASMVDKSLENALLRPIMVSRTMASSSTMKNAILEDANLSSEAVNPKLVEYLRSISDGMEYQMAFTVSALSKKYYTYDGVSKILDSKVDGHDIWYDEFLEKNMPYALNVDTDLDNDWSLSVFVNTKIEDEEGKLLGVCGVGVSMAQLQELIRKYEEEHMVEVALVDRNGLIQVASDGQKIENVYWSCDYFDNIGDSEFLFEIIDDHIRLTKYVPTLNWYVVIQDYNTDSLYTLDFVKPGLVSSCVSVILLLIAYAGINIHEGKMEKILTDSRKEQSELRKISESDKLTGLYNRYAYEMRKAQIDAEEMDDDLVVFIMDVNGLKIVNDNVGHNAGDELIVGAANCVRRVFEKYGYVYRIGGDEFCVIAKLAKADAEKLVKNLVSVTETWKGKYVSELSVSTGYACAIDYSEKSFEKLIKDADEHMYADKEAYYSRTGKDRRRR